MLLCDHDGRVLLGRDYRGDVGSVRVKAFCDAKLRRATGDEPPVMLFDGTSFFTRRLRGATLTLLGATNANMNAAAAVEALLAIEHVLLSFGVVSPGVHVTSSSLLSKAALIYELLDEARSV